MKDSLQKIQYRHIIKEGAGNYALSNNIAPNFSGAECTVIEESSKFMCSILDINYVSNNVFFTAQLLRILHFELRKFKF
jgi:hypothetical protein